ncbi:hypothetical protein QOZ80_8AG0637950 [Eleusine coracana subsp. coracana]|nr:hypothetical protein QOZ80_8AG0637950 [Eleusine coracana subsp. coracana]
MAAAASRTRGNQQLSFVLLHGLLLLSALMIGDVFVGAARPSSPLPTLVQAEQLRISSVEAPAPPGGWTAALTEQAAGGSERRLLVGSRVPTCTYNECRGCRHRCSIQQVPIDASDPINSAYHYRCVCHI